VNFDRYFERQLDLAEQTRLPMFLHCRNASSDLIDIVSRHRHQISAAVVSAKSYCCTLYITISTVCGYKNRPDVFSGQTL